MAEKLFVRKASGLIRQFNPADALFMNLIGIATMVSVIALLYAAPVVYPGANLFVAFTIGLIVAIPFGWTYAMLSTAYPRSGGDYVYISRITHPSIGLASSGTYLLANLIGVGQFPMFTAWYISSFFAILGILFDAPALVGAGSWVATVEGTIAVVTIIIIWSSIINIVGTRFHAIMQRIYFAIAAIGTILFFILLAISTQPYFVSSLSAYALKFGTSYEELIRKAYEMGYTVPPFSWGATTLTTVFLFGYLTTAWPTMVAGEIKRPARSLILSCVGGIFISWIMYMLTAGLYYHVTGEEFANSVAWLAQTHPEAYPLPLVPHLTYLIGFLHTNPIIMAVILLGFICWGLSLTPNHILICTRPLFAYAMDKTFPAAFASVSDRTHTPIFSTVFTAIVGEIVLLLTAYAGWLIGLTVNVTIICTLYFLFTLFTGLVFPFVKKDAFEAAPDVVKAKIGPIPVISITGGFTGIMMIYALAHYAIHPELSGPVTPLSMGFIIGWIVLFAIIYYIARWYRLKTEKVDISLSFKEIPPE